MGCKPTYKVNGIPKQFNSEEELKEFLVSMYSPTKTVSAVSAIYPELVNPDSDQKSVDPALQAHAIKSHKTSQSVIKNLEYVHETVQGKRVIDAILNQSASEGYTPLPKESLFKKVKSFLEHYILSTNEFLNIDESAVEVLMGVKAHSEKKAEKAKVIEGGKKMSLGYFKTLSAAQQLSLLQTHKYFKDLQNIINNTAEHPLNSKNLTPLLGKDEVSKNNDLHLIKFENLKKDSSEDAMGSIFTDMFFGNRVYENTDISEYLKVVARNLIRYNYFSSGLSFKASSFSKMFSEAVLNSDEIKLQSHALSMINDFNKHDPIINDAPTLFAQYNYQDSEVVSFLPPNEKYPDDVVWLKNYKAERMKDFVVSYNKKTKEYRLYAKSVQTETKVSYERIPIKSIPGKLIMPYNMNPIIPEHKVDSVVNIDKSLLDFGIEESEEVTDEKIEHLKSIFEAQGIEVEVVYDETIDGNAQIQKVGDKVVIKVKKVFEDTIIHEFGHLYVDLLGISNELVKKGIEQLRGTELYKEVSAAYPELSGIGLDKEVLVTAIGREGAKIFNDKRSQSKFMTTLNKIFRAIGKFLGITQNAARELARQMIENDLQTGFTGEVSTTPQKQKTLEKWIEDKSLALKTRRQKFSINKDREIPAHLTELIDIYDHGSKLGALESYAKYMQSSINKINLWVINYHEKSPEQRKNEGYEINTFISSSTSTVQGFYEDLKSLPDNETDQYTAAAITKIKELNLQTIEVQNKLEKIRETELQRLTKYSTNPDIVSGQVNLFDETVTKYFDASDESSTMLNMDALGDTNNSLVALALKEYRVLQDLNNKEIVKTKRRWLKIVEMAEKAGVPMDYFFEVMDGKKTGRFIQEYEDFRFERDKAAMFERAGKEENSFKAKDIIKTWFRENQVEVENREQIEKEKAMKFAEYSEEYQRYKRDKSRADGKSFFLPEVVDGVKTQVEYSTNPSNEELENIKFKFGSKTATYREWYWKNHYPSPEGDQETFSARDFPKGELVKPADKYLNPAYKQMTTNDAYSKHHEIYKKMMGLISELVIHTNENMVKKGFLPAVPKDVRSYWQAVTEPFKFNKKKDKEGDNLVETDEYGKVVSFLPFKYVRMLEAEDYVEVPKIPRNADQEILAKLYPKINKAIKTNARIKVENRERSAKLLDYDIKETMNLFIDSAMNHKFKTKMTPKMLLLEQQLEETRFVRTKGGEVQYNKTAKDSTGDQVPSIKSVGKESNLYKHFMRFKTMVFEENFNYGDDNATWVRIAAVLQDYSSITGIGFNIFSGINNKVYGEVMTAIESSSGQFFTTKNWLKAKLEYDKNVLLFFARRNKTESVNINEAIIKHFDVLQSQDELSGNAGGYVTSKLHRLAFIKDAAYAMNHAGEHSMQNQVLLAMLFKKKVMLNGKEIPLYNAFIIKDGHLELAKGVTSLDGSKFTEKNLSLIKDEVVGVNQYLHGIYNKMDAGTIQRFALGRLAVQFRKWARPGWNKRFGTKFGRSFWNERRNVLDEGYYVSVAKFAWSLTKDMANFRSNVSKNWGSLDETQKANAKRALSEFAFMIATIAAVMALTSKFEDDEKEDKTKLLALIVYQADRLKTELIAYTPVWGWWAEGKKLWTHPLPAYRNPTVLLKIMWQTVNLPFMDEKDTKFKGGQYYGEDKLRVWINQMIPFANHLQRWDHLEKSARYYKLWNF